MPVEERAETAWKLLKDLLKVDTTNPPGNEAPAAEIVARFLKREGLECVSVVKETGRPNLIHRQRGERGGGLLLAGHLDVVPAGSGDWTFPPFGAEESGGYLYGRGALDMKDMVAMSAVLAVEASKRTLKRDLVFAAVADEECGCGAGSKFLVEKHPDLILAEAMLGEGGGFTQYAAGAKFYPIGVGEKGHMSLKLIFRGRGGHGSIPNPESAAYKAAEAIGRLRPEAFPLHHTETARRFFTVLGKSAGIAGIGIGALSVPALAPAVLGLLPEALGASLRALLSHSVSPTTLRGSAAMNVIPEVVEVGLDVRMLPGFSAEEVLAEIWGVIGGEVEHEVLESHEGLVSRDDTELFGLMAASLARHDPGAAAAPFLMPYFTDGGFFRRLGIQCYGFTPLVLSRTDAAELKSRVHGTDERISKDAFLKGYAILEETVFSFVAGRGEGS